MMQMIRNAILVTMVCFVVTSGYAGERRNVIIVVIDGARYSETFGAKEKYIPTIWNDLRPQGTIFTKVKNRGVTKTCPGHTAMLTGEWQTIANDGSERPKDPTIFEYFRKQTGQSAQSCFVISGKSKLDVLTYGNDQRFGSSYGASFVDGNKSDVETWQKLLQTMNHFHPQLVIVNLPEVDLHGHDSSWQEYLSSIRRADSIVGLLWNAIQSDSLYRNTTTLFVTNDHGRHDDQHGGFRNHGDSCEGCRHIMLLALGPQFNKNSVVSKPIMQIDIAPTSAILAGITMPPVKGKSFLRTKGIPRRY